jgi:uncharacterized protein (TIGR02301 family)
MLMRFLFACLVCLALTLPAAAQKPRRDTLEPAPVSNGAPTDPQRTLPYLAYTLGELHYLSYACDGLDAQEWRDRMAELLNMEAPDRGRLRNRLIDSFNDGYREQQRYRPICGPEVDAERRALAHRGRDLAEMMRSNYFD